MKQFVFVLVLLLSSSVFAFGGTATEIENGKFQVIAMRTQGHDVSEIEIQQVDQSPKMNHPSDFELVLKRIDHKQIMKGG